MVITSFRVEKKSKSFYIGYEEGMYAMPYCERCRRYVEEYHILDDYDKERSYIFCLRCSDKVRGPEPPKKGGGYPAHGRTERQKCKCQRCKGKGRVPVWSVAGIVITWKRCPECKGRKWVWC
jgi:hypothetical protein